MSTRTASGTDELFSSDLLYAQVQKIFQCPAFTVSDILRRFLSYIIEETIAGRSNTIKEYTIAVNVLHKPSSFKPQHDAIVRIHAGRLRRALNYYYKEQGLQDPIEISVPKGSYVPVFGDMRATLSRSKTNPKQIEQSQISESVVLVIMPFRTFETDISRITFADNLGQQLSAEFGRFSDFSVVSYYTTQQLSSKDKEICELASHFGAKYVITGSVLFEQRRLRVAVQLTHTHTGTQIWTELFHRNYSAASLFETSDYIVSRITGALGDFNGFIAQHLVKESGRNLSANNLLTFLSGYHDFYNLFNEDSFNKGLAFAEKAIQRNSDNEVAWAFLGELSLLAFIFNQTPPENPLIKGLSCARTAVKINAFSQQAHISLGMAYLFLNQKQLSLDALESALRLNPSASGRMGIVGCLMICAGEYNRGIGLIRKSIELNKAYPVIFNFFISLYYFKQKEYLQAYEVVENMGLPDLYLSIFLRLSILLQMGRKKEVDMLIRSIRHRPLNNTWISREYISRFLLDTELVEKLYIGIKSANIPLLTVA